MSTSFADHAPQGRSVSVGAVRHSDLSKSQARAGYLFAFPALALYVVFVLAPVVLTVILSFAYFDPQLGSHGVGIDNFKRFFTDPRLEVAGVGGMIWMGCGAAIMAKMVSFEI